jgi:hypothetical protein
MKIEAKWLNRGVFALRVANLGPIVRRRMQAKFERQADSAIDDMKARVPVRKGNLRNSIRREPHPKHYPGVRIIAGGVPETQHSQNPSGHIFDEAILTEYGTHHQAAEPFFNPVIQEHFGDQEGARVQLDEEDIG